MLAMGFDHEMATRGILRHAVDTDWHGTYLYCLRRFEIMWGRENAPRSFSLILRSICLRLNPLLSTHEVRGIMQTFPFFSCSACDLS